MCMEMVAHGVAHDLEDLRHVHSRKDRMITHGFVGSPMGLLTLGGLCSRTRSVCVGVQPAKGAIYTIPGRLASATSPQLSPNRTWMVVAVAVFSMLVHGVAEMMS